MPRDLIKHVFKLPDLIKDFPDDNVLNEKVTSSADFFSLRRKIISRLLLSLRIYRLKEMNDNMMVSMVTQERIGSPEAVLICILHLERNIPPTKRIANQSVCMGDQFSMGSAGYCFVTKGASPQKS